MRSSDQVFAPVKQIPQPSTPPLYGYAEGTAADEPRHGARVTSLAEVPFNSDNGVSRRATLGLKQDDVRELRTRADLPGQYTQT